MRDADSEYTWFFRGEFPAVVRTAYLILRDRQAAEDIAQEAFTQLLVHWKKVSAYDRPDSWVRRVAVRLAVRTLRRDRLRTVLHRSEEPPPGLAPRDLDVARAVRSLPPQQRAAVALFYFEDRPIEEIASILNCSSSTAKAHLFKARRRLATQLHEEEETLDVT